MSAKWRESAKAEKHVMDVLVHTGTPLEVEVAHLCRDFCRRNDGERPRITTLRPIYSNLQPSRAAREVDQSVQFDGYVDINEYLGVRLRIRVPIECKHRQGLNVFGFPRPRKERTATLPTVSDFAGAVLVNQLAYTEPTIVAQQRECAVTLLTHDGNTCRIYKEQLLEKAGAALYDFVRTVEKRDRTQVDDLVIASNLIDRFKAFLPQSGDWFGNFRRFIRTLDPTDFYNFNRDWTQGTRRYLEVSIHVPMVCVDAPVFIVPCTRSGSIRRFMPTHTILTGLRLKRWPGRMSFDLGRRSPEALVLVSDVQGVKEVLQSCFEWYDDMVQRIETTDAIAVQRAILEGILYRSIAAANELALRRRYR